jgi:hypothetical protein
MRKLLTWLVVTLGVAALVRRFRRRREAPAPWSSPSPTEDPASELRRKLAASRAETAAPETTPEESVAERRAEVHDEARAALEEMRSRDQGE